VQGCDPLLRHRQVSLTMPYPALRRDPAHSESSGAKVAILGLEQPAFRRGHEGFRPYSCSAFAEPETSRRAYVHASRRNAPLGVTQAYIVDRLATAGGKWATAL
jgi:hypothetical protein